MMKDFIVVVLLCIVFNTKAQFIQNSITYKDTINIKFETVAAISNHAYQPHWITYNNWGVINESEQLNLVGIASVEATVQLIKDVSFQYGLEAVVRNSSSIPYETEKASVYFNEWYIGVNLKSLYIGGGARKMIMGDVNVELSSGSLHLSSNSRPIPQLLLTTNDWVEIPYTKEYLSFKGLFSHGWLSNERYIDDTYIHNKNFYLKLGKVNHAWFGINHSVVWGGDDHGDKLPSDWTAFWTVVKAGKYMGYVSRSKLFNAYRKLLLEISDE